MPNYFPPPTCTGSSCPFSCFTFFLIAMFPDLGS
uniref:Uncharacterized protein n=1 Tax=Anguilla anguilla TaxID=7936 RepID=A0A0E9TFY8_ANGAN